MNHSLPALQELAIEAALEAAAGLRSAFLGKKEVRWKGKNDPVTDADLHSDAVIRTRLASGSSAIPVISEEGELSLPLLRETCLWIVDPIDGTADFVDGSPAFAVHIGLCVNGRPCLGVVAHPMRRLVYVGMVGEGAFIQSESARTPCRVSDLDTVQRVAVSGRHRGRTLDLILGRLGRPTEVVSGSSGLKSALVATGTAELYIAASSKLGLWDVAAPEALVLAAGGVVTDLDGAAIDYRRPDFRVPRGLVVSNFYVRPEVAAALHELLPARGPTL